MNKMLNEKVVKLIQEQINKELFSAYLYLDMANYYVYEGLDGFANWFKVQAQEEEAHAMIFTDYLQANGIRVVLDAIEKPEIEWSSFKKPLEEALKHEQFVTASIHNIYDEALKNKDYRTMDLLNWFVKEQLEEEMNAEQLIDQYNLFAKDGGQGLYSLNKDLGTRAFTPPTFTVA